MQGRCLEHPARELPCVCRYQLSDTNMMLMCEFLAIGSCDEAKVPKISKNGFQQKRSHSVGSIFRYKCNKGYRLVGPTTAYCTPTGWSVGQAPVCASKSSKGERGILSSILQGLGAMRGSYSVMMGWSMVAAGLCMAVLLTGSEN